MRTRTTQESTAYNMGYTKTFTDICLEPSGIGGWSPGPGDAQASHTLYTIRVFWFGALVANGGLLENMTVTKAPLRTGARHHQLEVASIGLVTAIYVTSLARSSKSSSILTTVLVLTSLPLLKIPP